MKKTVKFGRRVSKTVAIPAQYADRRGRMGSWSWSRTRIRMDAADEEEDEEEPEKDEGRM